MKGITSSVLLSFCLLSCGLEEIGTGVHSNADGIWTGPPTGLNGQVYMTVLDYPDGYDWRSDPDPVSCSLVMFSDGIPVLRIPVGDGHQVSKDPDRHRMIGGHLYTDWSDGICTVIKKDGRELFRYQGFETIVRMLVHDGKVHSLSKAEGSAGFIYRVDGEVVMRHDDARVFEHLYLYGDSVGFCFSRLVSEASGAVRRYYSVLDGCVEKVDVEGDVWDMKMYPDGLYVLVSDSGCPLPVLICGDVREVLEPFLGTEFRSAEFLDSDTLCVNIRYSAPGDSSPTSLLWFGNGNWRQYLLEKTTAALCYDGQTICMIYNHSSGVPGKICIDYDMFEMPSGYDVRGVNPVACGESGIQVGLTSTSGGRPAVWTGGEVRELNVNGYIVKASSSDDISG